MMKTFKQICKKNWYIIASALFLFVYSEVLLGIMTSDSRYFKPEASSFDIEIMILKVVILIIGVLITYLLTGILKAKFSLPIVTGLAVLAYIFRENELNLLLNYTLICFVAAMLCMAFYYVNYCTDSIIHTLIYIAVSVVLWGTMFFGIEIFIVLSTNIFLFIANQKSVSRKSVRAANLIFTAVSATMFVLTFFARIVNHMDYRHDRSGYLEIGYTESDLIPLLEKMMISSNTFGASEYFGEFANERYVYNLAKIFGYYGYYIGIATIMLVAFFTVCILIGCYKKQDKIKSVCGAAAIMLTVRTLSALFINLGIISIVDSHFPFVTLSPCCYMNIGLIIGFMLAADKENLLKRNN